MLDLSFLIILIFAGILYTVGVTKKSPLVLFVAGIVILILGMSAFTEGVQVSDNLVVQRNSLDSNRVIAIDTNYTTYIGSLTPVVGKVPDSGLFFGSYLLFFSGIFTMLLSIVPVVRGRWFG